MKIRRVVYSGVLLAMAILLPQAFHLTGVPQSGAVFLPMHIPVLMAGFLVGPLYGVIIGIVAPIISFFMTGMPTAARLPFMIGELAAYGLFSGLLYSTWNLYKMKLGILFSLIGAMAAGRLVYAGMLWIAADLLHIPCGGPIAAITAISLGVSGIVIQLVFIPPIIYALQKGGITYVCCRES